MHMNSLIKYIVTAITLSSTALGLAAQDSSSSSSSIVRRRAGGRERDAAAPPGVTDRMQQFYRQNEQSDADRLWMRVIYRALELDNPKNAALYYPEEVIDGQENLFRIIMRLLADNQIAAYEYLDGKEIFTDKYKLKVRDMLDRFHVLYTDAKGSTEKNPKFTIEESDVPANEVLSYYILERWEFDARSNKTKRRVEAICPVLHRSDDFGADAVRYPMFWVKLDALRPYLAQQYVFLSDDNNLAQHSIDDYFNLTMYKGDIYKTRNLRNLSMAQMFPDEDDRKRAQDSIDNRLRNYGKNLWVPDREEYLAMREKEDAKKSKQGIAADTIPERTIVEAESVSEEKPSSAARAKKRATKKRSSTKKPKVSSSSSSNSGAAKSVRRRKK